MKPQRLSIVIVLITLAALVAAILVKPKYGLDIRGGARVVLEADTSKLGQGQKWDSTARDSVVRTINNRINANGVSEPTITTKGDKQFVVEIPAIRNEQEVLEQLQNTTQLQFFSASGNVRPRSFMRWPLILISWSASAGIDTGISSAFLPLRIIAACRPAFMPTRAQSTE